MDAKKNTLKLSDALALLKDVTEVYAAKGKHVVHYDLRRDKPSEADLAAILLGPTGNLRAPALRKGGTLVVGFDPETYAKVFG